MRDEIALGALPCEMVGVQEGDRLGQLGRRSSPAGAVAVAVVLAVPIVIANDSEAVVHMMAAKAIGESSLADRS